MLVDLISWESEISSTSAAGFINYFGRWSDDYLALLWFVMLNCARSFSVSRVLIRGFNQSIQ